VDWPDGLTEVEAPDLAWGGALRYGLLEERAWEAVDPVLDSGMPAKVLPK